jgi:hypothetical protein
VEVLVGIRAGDGKTAEIKLRRDVGVMGGMGSAPIPIRYHLGMVQITLQNVGIPDKLPSTPDGGKVLIFVDQQSGIQVAIPLDSDATKRIVGLLKGITVATQMP